MSELYNIDNQLNDILSPLGWHGARIKFFVRFICALIKLQTISYIKLSEGLGGKAKIESNLRRIQRFFAEFDLNLDVIASLVFKLLPLPAPYTLSMDRTNWKFGGLDFNILTLSVCYQGLGIPLMWMMLPKKGNSNTNERKQLVGRYIRLFGADSIECLLADREFVGKHWFKWLIGEKIKFHLRIKENMWIDVPGKGKVRASWLFNNPQSPSHYPGIVRIDDNELYLSGIKTISKDGVAFVIIASYNREYDVLEKYRDRWQIETMFKTFKSSGFNLEDTHLTDTGRLSKLIGVVCVAFIWAYRAGIFRHENDKPIRVLKNGRRAKSIFKYGLEKLSNILSSLIHLADKEINKTIDKYVKLLSCT